MTCFLKYLFMNLALFSTSTVFAMSECTDINNLKEPLVTKSGKLKPRDQDSLGWCYAYAAADMLSHELGQEISAIDLTVSFKEEDFWGYIEGLDELPMVSELDGGFSQKAIRHGFSKGFCLENDVPSTDFLYALESQSYLKELGEIEKLFYLYQKNTTSPFLFNFRKNKELRVVREYHMKLYQDLTCRSDDFPKWQTLFPNLSVDDFIKILSQSTSSFGFIKGLIENSCQTRIKPTNSPVKFFSSQRSQTLYEMIKDGRKSLKELEIQATPRKMRILNEGLEKGKIVGVHYYHKMLFDPKFATYESELNHASTIVARRLNKETKTCEYMLRNTWGRSCNVHHSYECIDGHIWIPQSVIEIGVKDVFYIL